MRLGLGRGVRTLASNASAERAVCPTTLHSSSASSAAAAGELVDPRAGMTRISPSTAPPLRSAPSVAGSLGLSGTKS